MVSYDRHPRHAEWRREGRAKRGQAGDSWQAPSSGAWSPRKAELEALGTCSLPWSERHLTSHGATRQWPATGAPQASGLHPHPGSLRQTNYHPRVSAEEAELEGLSASPQGTHWVPLGSGLFTDVPQLPPPPPATAP